MSNSPLYAGVDLGTSGVRIVVIDAQDRTVAESRKLFAEYGDNHRDPGCWTQALSACFLSILQKVSSDDIVAISIDGTSGTMLALDEEGRPVREPLMYNDACSDNNVLSIIASVAPADSAAHGASSALARAIKLQDAVGTKQLLHQADWASGLLSGRFDTTDENNALKTGYDPIERQWPEWLSHTGVRLELLPSVTEPGSPIAHCEGQLAQQVGLSKKTIVVAGTTDGCASFLATGADNVGDGVTALGSTLTIKMLSDRPIFSPEYGIYSHRMPGGWLAGGASNTGGNVIAEYFDAGEIEAHSSALDPLTETGLDFYPLLKAGERFPHNDSQFQPIMEPRPDSDLTFFKAILEGISTIERTGFDRLHQLGSPRLASMRTVGGGAANNAWMQMRQARLKVPFEKAHSEEAAFGTARLAKVGASGGAGT